MRRPHSIQIRRTCLTVALLLSVGGCSDRLDVRRENTLRAARARINDKDSDPISAMEGRMLLDALDANTPNELKKGVPVCAWLCVDPGYNVLNVIWCADRPLPATIHLRGPHGTLSLPPKPVFTEMNRSRANDYVLMTTSWSQHAGDNPNGLWAWLFANTNGCTVVVEQKGREPIGPIPLQVIPRDN